MPYEITFLSKEAITPGNCLTCYLHFINMNPNPGEPATGCELSGEFLPDDWDTEKVLWDRCPVLYSDEGGHRGMLDKFGKLVRDIRITRSLLLYDMAKTLDISPAELSAIESGKSRFLTGSFLHSKRTMALATLVLTCCPSLLRIEVIDICPVKIERTRRGIRTRRPTPP